MCAVCRSVAVPAVRHILRLTQHLAVAGVCVPRGAGSQDAKFTGRAAEEAHRRGIIQRELHCRRERSTYDEHQQQRAREGRAEFEGELLHASHVPRDPLGHMHAHGHPCLLISARLPNLDPHFLWGSAAHHPPGRQRARRAHRRWRSSSSWGTRWVQRERGGARAPWRAPVAMWSY